MTFGSQYCTTHSHNTSVTVQGVTEESSNLVYQAQNIFQPQIRPEGPFRGNIVMLNRSSFFQTVKRGILTIFKASLYDINNATEAKEFEETPPGGGCS